MPIYRIKDGLELLRCNSIFVVSTHCLLLVHLFLLIARLQFYCQLFYSQFILMYFSLIVKQAIFAYVNHARFRSWNQPVLSYQSKVSCLRKQRGTLMGLNSRLKGIHQSRVSQTHNRLRQAASFYGHIVRKLCFYLFSYTPVNFSPCGTGCE